MEQFWTWLVSNSNACMVLLTGLTIIISLFIQIRMEYHRNEDIRARIDAYLMSDDLHTYLCLANVGKRIAWNVHININEDFINELPGCFENKIYLKSLCSNTITLAPEEKLHYLIYSGNMGERMCEDKEILIKIKGKYCNRYHINQKISLNEYLNRPPYKLFYKS